MEQDKEQDLVHLLIMKDDLSKLIDKEMRCQVEFPDREKKNVVIQDIRPKENRLLLTCKLK